MKHLIIIVHLLVFSLSLLAQEKSDKRDGTIKVQKAGHLVSVQFDAVNYRVICIDEYGNPLDTAVQEFRMGVTIQGIFYTENTKGSLCSSKMQQLLTRADQSSNIIIDKIKAKDRNGTVVDMPKIIYSFGSRNDDGN
jgi:hypothetical protein